MKHKTSKSFIWKDANNVNRLDHKLIGNKIWNPSTMKTLVYQLQIDEEGKEYYYGYVEFFNPKTMSTAVRALLPGFLVEMNLQSRIQVISIYQGMDPNRKEGPWVWGTLDDRRTARKRKVLDHIPIDVGIPKHDIYEVETKNGKLKTTLTNLKENKILKEYRTCEICETFHLLRDKAVTCAACNELLCKEGCVVIHNETSSHLLNELSLLKQLQLRNQVRSLMPNLMYGKRTVSL